MKLSFRSNKNTELESISSQSGFVTSSDHDQTLTASPTVDPITHPSAARTNPFYRSPTTIFPNYSSSTHNSTGYSTSPSHYEYISEPLVSPTSPSSGVGQGIGYNMSPEYDLYIHTSNGSDENYKRSTLHDTRKIPPRPPRPPSLELYRYTKASHRVTPGNEGTDYGVGVTRDISYSNKSRFSKANLTTKFRNFKDSFTVIYWGDHFDDQELTEVERRVVASAKIPLVRGLKPRHVQMIAFGGAIGTGLFIRSGTTLALAGPASVLVGFGVTGLMMMMTIQALGELAVRFPVAGSFTAYSTRFIDPAWGFAMGWNFALNWLFILPIELIGAAIALQYWNSSSVVNPAAWVSIFYIAIVMFNIFGVGVYGEIEFAFSIVKILALTAFMVLGIVLAAGGSPQGYIGGKYWHDPGAFVHGLKGVAFALSNAAFAFSGTELCGLAASETKNPRRTIPSAVKQVCWRIVLFYIVSLVIVGCLVPHNEKRLLGGTSSVDASTSPFVIAIKNAGIKGLPSVFNAVILLAVVSVANSAVYAASRTLAGLGASGQAPAQFCYIDRKGRPLIAIGFTFFIGLLCFVCGSKNYQVAFEWLLSLSSLSSILTWASICLSHIRFRYGLKSQGRTTDELTFAAPFGVYGSFLGLVLAIFILGLLVWTALFPIDDESANVSSFFKTYLAAPIVGIFYVSYKIIFKTKIVRTREMDLDTGIRFHDLEMLKLEIDEENARIKSKGWLYYLYKLWC